MTVVEVDGVSDNETVYVVVLRFMFSEKLSSRGSLIEQALQLSVAETSKILSGWPVSITYSDLDSTLWAWVTMALLYTSTYAPAWIYRIAMPPLPAWGLGSEGPYPKGSDS